MTKSKPASPIQETPTEWRRILLEETPSGEIRPVAVGPANGGDLESDPPTLHQAGQLAKEVPQEWQDILQAPSSSFEPIHNHDPISLYQDENDPADLTIPGVSISELFKDEETKSDHFESEPNSFQMDDDYSYQSEAFEASIKMALEDSEQEEADESTSKLAQHAADFPFANSPSGEAFVQSPKLPPKTPLLVPAPKAESLKEAFPPPPSFISQEKSLPIDIQNKKSESSYHRSTVEELQKIHKENGFTGKAIENEEEPEILSGEDLVLLEEASVEFSLTTTNEVIEKQENINTATPLQELDSVQEALYAEKERTPSQPMEAIKQEALYAEKERALSQPTEAVKSAPNPFSRQALPPSKAPRLNPPSAAVILPTSLEHENKIESYSVELKQDISPDFTQLQQQMMQQLAQFQEQSNSQFEQMTQAITSQQIASERLEKLELVVEKLQEEQQDLIKQLKKSNELLSQINPEASIENSFKTVYPVFQDLLQLYDYVELRFRTFWESHGEEHPIVREASSIRDQILETLTRHGLEAIETTSYDYNPQEHRVLQEVPTYNPDEDGQISRIFRQGFRYKSDVFRATEVEIKRYQAS